ncbi:MAG TPA: transcription antitermination factor NusB [Actinomycetota bacterium]|nr:transcription antitermination factor NusB [Actinomycetota bacterium]
MAHRRGSRKLALDVLYEHEVRNLPTGEILQRYTANPGYAFAAELVQGVSGHAGELDEMISRHAKEWSIERMPVIDRNLLRMALFEMLYLEDVPAPVAINEAVELAKIYSTEDSSRFVNGLLGSVSAELSSRGV